VNGVSLLLWGFRLCSRGLLFMLVRQYVKPLSPMGAGIPRKQPSSSFKETMAGSGTARGPSRFSCDWWDLSETRSSMELKEGAPVQFRDFEGSRGRISARARADDFASTGRRVSHYVYLGRYRQ